MEKLKGNLITILMLTVGAFLGAYALETFLIPNTILDGGVTGISIIISKMTSLPMSLLVLILNVPFIFIGMLIKTLFFVRKGFGEDYCKGILEGICDCKKCWKVKFRMKNLSNYFKIQLELWCNLVRII